MRSLIEKYSNLIVHLDYNRYKELMNKYNNVIIRLKDNAEELIEAYRLLRDVLKYKYPEYYRRYVDEMSHFTN